MSDNKVSTCRKCSTEDCNFWIAPEDGYCPNCGKIFLPRDTSDTIGCLTLLILLVLSPVVTATTGWAFIIISSVVALIAFAMIKSNKEIKYLKKLGLEEIISLRKEEENIRKKLVKLAHEFEPIKKKLNTQEERLLSNKQEIIDARAENRLKDTINNLDKALSIIRSHRKLLQSHQTLLEVRLWGIELERWLNTLKPLIVSWVTWERLTTESQYKDLLENFKTVYNTGNEILQKWNKQEEAASTDEGEKYIQRIKEALEACGQLSDELLARKAHLTIQGVEIKGLSSSYQVNNIPLDQIYDVIAFAELQKQEISKIETQITEKINNLETEQEIQQEVHNL